MRVNSIPMRGLDENIIDFIKNSDEAKGLREIIDSIRDGNEEELFIGIRNNFIAVYFRRQCVFKKIAFKIEGDKTVFSNVDIDEAYLEFVDSNEAKESLICLEGVKKIKKGIVEHFKRTGKLKYEFIYQQEIVLANNGESNSKWFCFDMEYDMGQRGYGRYDILAISTMLNTEKKYSIGLIELKVDSKSLGSGKEEIKELLDEGMIREEGYSEYKVITKLNMKNVYSKGSLGSRVLGHFSDYIRYINDNEYMEKHNTSRFSVTKQEAVNILKNYDELTLCDGKFKEMVKDLNIDKISDVPKFIFLNYARDEKVKSVKTSFRNNVLGSNNFAIEKVWDEKVIDQYRGSDSEIQFKCIFKEGFPEDEANRAIFSDVEISEAKNIFDEEAYK